MAAMNPKMTALNRAMARSASWLSSPKVAKKLEAVMWMDWVPKYRPPAMPATDTMLSRSNATNMQANSLGRTRRCSGWTPMTSMDEISSRIFREPISAHMADPPAPAMSREVGNGACSHRTARTKAAPSRDEDQGKGRDLGQKPTLVDKLAERHAQAETEAYRLEPRGEHGADLFEEPGNFREDGRPGHPVAGHDRGGRHPGDLLGRRAVLGDHAHLGGVVRVAGHAPVAP